jgi:prephenate dehydrogenase
VKPTVAVCGLGLIGGSLALALSERGYRVLGIDLPGPLRRARRARAIEGGTRLETAVDRARLLVLAAPPAANLQLLRRIARLAPGATVTDVTSVKRPIVAEARRLGLRAFVGGHPMAGNEGSGFAAASGALFRGHPWIVVPGGDPAALRRILRLVRDVGARPVALGAEEHDRVVARLSHVPQIVAWALMAAAGADPATRRRLRLAGPGFRDMTRLARSPRRLWREILRANRDEVEGALQDLRAALSPGRFWR